MEILFWIILMTALNGVASLVGVLYFWVNEKYLNELIFLMVSFAAGSLLSGAFFHLMARSFETLPINLGFGLLLVGFSSFFLMEKYFFWHHCHEAHCKVHPITYLILVGDGIHNFVDGLIIAASFLVNINFGIVTTLVIIGHEIPQELSDFGILLYGGFEKKKALVYNFISQLTSILGGIVGFFIAGVYNFSALILPFAAGGFIYIVASDLIPEIKNEKDKKKSVISFVFFLIGIGFTLFMKAIFD